MNTPAKFSDLIGKTLVSVNGAKKGSEAIIFTTSDGEVYKMYHEQDCCESVTVEDVYGDVCDLIRLPILRASEDSNNENPPDVPASEYQDDSFTWTFYNIATAQGHVTIRWYGESNGYYSESVDFEKIA